MKKIGFLVVVILIAGLIHIAPVPIITSGFVAQYEAGKTMQFDIAAWNLSVLNRTVTDNQAQNIVLKVDGKPIATTPVQQAATLEALHRFSQTVNYRLGSGESSDSASYDETTGTLNLSQGKHDVSVEWLGASSLGHTIVVVKS